MTNETEPQSGVISPEPQSGVISVELRPYEGMEKRRGKLRRTERPQKWVWIKGAEDDQFERVGLVADEPGCRFCAHIPLSEFTDDELDAINRAIAEFHGATPPPAVGLPEDTQPDDDVADPEFGELETEIVEEGAPIVPDAPDEPPAE